MKTNILSIAHQLKVGEINVDEAKAKLLILFSVVAQNEQLDVFTEWLKDHYTIIIPDRVINEYKRHNVTACCKKDKCKHWNGLFNRCKFVNADCCQAVL